MLYTLRPANFCITFRADYGRAYDRIARRENWGWLIAPLAWLLVALLSASLALLLYTTALVTPHAIRALMSQSALNIATWFVSFVFAIAMWYYTLWLTIAFFKRRKTCQNITLSGCWSPCCWLSKHSLSRQCLTRWRFASYCFRYWRRRLWSLISSVRRALRRPLSTRNNLTVNLLWPVVVYPIIGGYFISG